MNTFTTIKPLCHISGIVAAYNAYRSSKTENLIIKRYKPEENEPNIQEDENSALPSQGRQE